MIAHIDSEGAGKVLIMGKCPYCEELVWSGDWEFDRYFRFSHVECVERERERVEQLEDKK